MKGQTPSQGGTSNPHKKEQYPPKERQTNKKLENKKPRALLNLDRWSANFVRKPKILSSHRTLYTLWIADF